MTLASSAASALVGAMAKDGWGALRSRVAGLLGRGDARAEQVVAWRSARCCISGG